MKKTLAKKAKSPGATHNDRVEAAQALRHYDYMLKIKLETDKENKKKRRGQSLQQKLLENCKRCDKWHVWKNGHCTHL